MVFHSLTEYSRRMDYMKMKVHEYVCIENRDKEEKNDT